MTGTTIAGIVFRDGVVLGADQRATEGTLIADPNCTKIHRLCDNVFACGAGTSADAAQLCRHVCLDLTLLRRREEAVRGSTSLPTRVELVRGVLRSRAKASPVECGLIVGGVDDLGVHLYRIDATGATHALRCAVLGSGSLASSATIEAAYKDDMDREAAIVAVKNAVSAGIVHDIMSGGRVNVLVLHRDGACAWHTYDVPAQ